MTQLCLDFASRRVTLGPKTAGPAPLVDLLRAHGGWLSAKAIAAALGVSDREVRAMAAASGGEVISGQMGYRLTRSASLDEIRHASAWLRSQAREMLRRSIAIQKVAHASV
jgi:hypothetical protein